MYTICVGRVVNLHTLHNLFKLCNILSPNPQRKYSFIHHFRKCAQIKWGAWGGLIFSAYIEQRNVKHLEDFRSRGQLLRGSVRAQRPDILGGTNACGYYDQPRSKEMWPGSTNRCQPSILPALELSEVKKVCLCVGLELGWLAPGSIWSWPSLQLAATQMDRQFCWTGYMNSV